MRRKKRPTTLFPAICWRTEKEWASDPATGSVATIWHAAPRGWRWLLLGAHVSGICTTRKGARAACRRAAAKLA